MSSIASHIGRVKVLAEVVVLRSGSTFNNGGGTHRVYDQRWNLNIKKDQLPPVEDKSGICFKVHMLLSGYGAAVQLVRRLLEGWTTPYHFVPIEDLTNYVHFLKCGIYREPWKAYYPCPDWPNSEWTLQKPIRFTPSGPPLLCSRTTWRATSPYQCRWLGGCPVSYTRPGHGPPK